MIKGSLIHLQNKQRTLSENQVKMSDRQLQEHSFFTGLLVNLHAEQKPVSIYPLHQTLHWFFA